MNFWLVLPSIISALGGCALLIRSLRMHLKAGQWDAKEDDVKKLHIYAMAVLGISIAAALFAAWGSKESFTAFSFVDGIALEFAADGTGALFATVTCFIWGICGLYSCMYMRHEKNETRYFGFFLIVFAVVIALDFSANLVTFYLFYELMTLSSMPLVLHSGSDEAVKGALKYLFYSLIGAYLALFCIYFLNAYTDSLRFTPGGTLNTALTAGHTGILLFAVFCMLAGFGAKAGMFPLHGWLPSAHPVAPAPASAALSSIIVKGGVLAIIRTLYFIVGADFIRGTWVQSAWSGLTLVTVLMGSCMAYFTPDLKKRLAYSTVSQVSYALFGLSLLEKEAFCGALLQVVFHAFAKCALFLTAGIFIYKTGKTDVKDYRAIGKYLPLSLWVFLFASLSLIGIPPFGGFISKWHLALGALDLGSGIYAVAGPVILLISALLTAGYLLPVCIDGFLPGADDRHSKNKEELNLMNIPAAVAAAAAIVLGICPAPLLKVIDSITSMIL